LQKKRACSFVVAVEANVRYEAQIMPSELEEICKMVVDNGTPCGPSKH
jgi:hypothetical protein